MAEDSMYATLRAIQGAIEYELRGVGEATVRFSSNGFDRVVRISTSCRLMSGAVVRAVEDVNAELLQNEVRQSYAIRGQSHAIRELPRRMVDEIRRLAAREGWERMETEGIDFSGYSEIREPRQWRQRRSEVELHARCLAFDIDDEIVRSLCPVPESKPAPARKIRVIRFRKETE